MFSPHSLVVSTQVCVTFDIAYLNPQRKYYKTDLDNVGTTLASINR